MLSVLDGIDRKVVTCAAGDDEEGRRSTARLRMDGPPDQVLRACTRHDQLAAWLAPVDGDLRQGGSFTVDGSAHGTVLACTPQADGHLFRVTWLYGDQPETSELTVRLTATDDGRTEATLEHLATHDPENWADFGPAATGVGWDLMLLGLALHVRGETVTEDWHQSPEAADVKRASVLAWTGALAEWGAPEEHVLRAANNSLGFYLGAAPPGS